MNGQEGFIPSPHIFYATAIVSLLAIIPLALTSKVETDRDAS